MGSSDKQKQDFQDFLVRIADGDFDATLNLTNESDEQLTTMQVGVNMLVEELKFTTISRVFLNSIYDGINDIIIILNEKGEIQKTNHLVETLLLYTESELLYKSIEKLLQVNDLDTVKDFIKTAYEIGEIQEIGLNFITKINSIIPVSCSFSVLRNKKHESSGVLLVAKNITTLLQAKIQLQDKNDELNLFVYKASHDLKGPVSSIQGIMNLLNKTEDIGEMKKYCKMIDECAKNLDIIISNLLELGRVNHGDLINEKVNVKHTIDDILNSIEFLDVLKYIHININVDEHAVFINTDCKLLKTILFNLIDNAIKYRRNKEEPSFIKINVSIQDKDVILIIEDNGIGIEESLQTNIFKMFYRATYSSKGSGLGLYIVKMSVLKLGGKISFESTLDKGTTFTLLLPSH